jgi:mono/diheme cytochrome c family protein
VRNTNWTRCWVAVGAWILAGLMVDASVAIAEDPPPADLGGKDLYVRHCGACHGNDARGRTPISDLIRVETPDLTQIAMRRQGWFPDVLVREIIDGRFKIHGERMMPIWGNALSQEQIIAITEHLYSLQTAFP